MPLVGTSRIHGGMRKGLVVAAFLAPPVLVPRTASQPVNLTYQAIDGASSKGARTALRRALFRAPCIALASMPNAHGHPWPSPALRWIILWISYVLLVYNSYVHFLCGGYYPPPPFSYPPFSTSLPPFCT